MWMDFDGQDVIWKPETVTVYQPVDEKLENVPAFGSFDQDFTRVNLFEFEGTLSLCGEVTSLTTIRFEDYRIIFAKSRVWSITYDRI